MEFILSPFLNYDFIFISLAYSRGGVGEERKGKDGGRGICYRFKAFVVIAEPLAVSKVQGFNGSRSKADLIPTELELRRHVTNAMKT